MTTTVEQDTQAKDRFESGIYCITNSITGKVYVGMRSLLAGDENPEQARVFATK